MTLFINCVKIIYVAIQFKFIINSGDRHETFIFFPAQFQNEAFHITAGCWPSPLTAISVFYQSILDNRITKDIESASIDRLRYISFNLQQQMEISDQLLGWITYNRHLQNILTENYSKIYEKQLDIIQFSSYAMEYAVNANIESNIFKILILEDDGGSFQIGNGMSLMDEPAIREAKWPEIYEHCRPDQLTLSKDIYIKDTYIFPVSSRIYNDLTGTPIGWCLIAFRSDMYSRNLIHSSSNQNIYLVNSEGQCIGHTENELIGTNMSEDSIVQKILNTSDSLGHITASRSGIPVIVHYYRVPDSYIMKYRKLR